MRFGTEKLKQSMPGLVVKKKAYCKEHKMKTVSGYVKTESGSKIKVRVHSHSDNHWRLVSFRLKPFGSEQTFESVNMLN